MKGKILIVSKTEKENEFIFNNSEIEGSFDTGDREVDCIALKRHILEYYIDDIACIYFKIKDLDILSNSEKKKFIKSYHLSIENDSKEVFLERWGLVDCQITLGEQVIF